MIPKLVAHKAQPLVLDLLIVGSSDYRHGGLLGEREDAGVHAADTAETKEENVGLGRHRAFSLDGELDWVY